MAKDVGRKKPKLLKKKPVQPRKRKKPVRAAAKPAVRSPAKADAPLPSAPMIVKSRTQSRPPDIVPTTNEALINGLMRKHEELGRPVQRAGAKPATVDDLRKDFLESPESDPTGFERVIGESDLTSINYLDRGLRAAAAVCRIRSPVPGGEFHGSGFLVGPRLLITNHHVLSSPDEASQCEAEFGYEHDVDGVLKRPVSFNLKPHELFFTSASLDFTLVAVAPLSEGGVPLNRFGWLPLLPLAGKVIDKEWATIIQHPGGGPKQISIRSNRIIKLPPGAVPGCDIWSFIHYLTDTEPGSSGSPVFNDQWQVVALHHKAVPAPAALQKQGEATVWIGNEGVRISAIYRHLEQNRLENAHAARALNALEGGLGFTPIAGAKAGGDEDVFEKDAKPYAPARWTKKAGYDADFLGRRNPIPLEDIYAKLAAKNKLAPLLTGKGHELHYNRFSVVVHKERKFAVMTAVNILGKKLKHPGARQTAWRTDPRMDEVYQPAADFYEKARGTDKIQFSRGHLVRRFDPSWGETQEEAQLGDQDTFHYTNAAPQFQTYNDKDWGNLEDYVLDRAQTTERRLSVFQGPIFRKADPFYGHDREGGPWRIPLSYWKIAVLEKTPGHIVAAAFILGQTQYVDALYEAKVFSKGLRPYTPEELRSPKIQTTVATIEKQTGLDFSALKEFDVQGDLESTRSTHWLTRLADIRI